MLRHMCGNTGKRLVWSKVEVLPIGDNFGNVQCINMDKPIRKYDNMVVIGDTRGRGR